MKTKITPSIWFTTAEGTLGPVLTYYQAAFGAHFKSGNVVSLGETPGGHSQMCTVELFGLPYALLSTANAHHPLNDAVSFIISCINQEEIDHYWNFFTSDGQESMCGWCIDKFGLRWQILPKNLDELMARPGASEVMMRQTKIVIEEYFG